MGEDIAEAVEMMAEFVSGTAPGGLSNPDSVADPEAVHAVQKHYAEAGFECDEETAQAIIDGAR